MTNQPTAFVEPPAADMELINTIHRKHDGYITFHTKEKRAGQAGFDVAACKASELEQVFPAFIKPWLNVDAFFSNNGMVMHPNELRQPSSRVPSLPRCHRDNDHLRYLTAAWVDLDVYKAGVTVGYALGVVHDLSQAGYLPPPSWFVDSGMGAWVGWLICDKKHRHLPQAAWPEQHSTWCRIMRGLQDKLKHLGADPQTMDPSRIMRVPGTINSKNNRRVSHWIPKDANDRPFVYTMDELAISLGVPPARHSPSVKRVIDPRYRERGIKGHIAQYANRYKQLVELAAMRGTIKEGTRGTYLHQLAVTGYKLREHGMPDWAETVRQVARHQCSPPYPADETERTIESAIKFGKKRAGRTFMMNRYKLANQLGVTDAEAETIGLPPAGAEPLADRVHTRADRINVRREHIRQYVENKSRHDYPQVPTLRVLADLVEGMTTERPALNTIKDDLKALGIINPRSHKGRQLPDKALWTMQGAAGGSSVVETSGASNGIQPPAP